MPKPNLPLLVIATTTQFYCIAPLELVKNVVHTSSCRRGRASRPLCPTGSCRAFQPRLSKGANMYQPVFLRASHSPWTFIPQKSLTIMRGLLLVYLLVSGAMVAYFKLTELTDHSKWYLTFHLGSISFVMTLIYHLITFVRCSEPSKHAMANHIGAVLDVYAPLLPGVRGRRRHSREMDRQSHVPSGEYGQCPQAIIFLHVSYCHDRLFLHEHCPFLVRHAVAQSCRNRHRHA